MSFGHLTAVRSPVAEVIALPTATATAIAIRPHRSGTTDGRRRMTDMAIDPPGGDCHGALPRRPRPAVWASATTVVPWEAPVRAISPATSFVDPTTGR